VALTTQVLISGNLTRDPELKQISSGRSVVSITIAVTPRTFDQEKKEWRDAESVFLRSTAWGDLAEHIAHSLKKGDRVLASGTLKPTNWTNREGVKMSGLELTVEDIGPSLLRANATPVKGDHSYTAQIAKADDDGWVTVDDDTPF
jgi:single-strand DNA-binding protein